ncbi:nitroreductase, partial [bacterium]|nr:nitroreductase [bacterium]
MKGMTVEEAIGARRSIRRYSAEPLTLRELSQL